MRSLFVKLFVSFCLIMVMAATVSGLLLYTLQKGSFESMRNRLVAHFDERLGKSIMLNSRSGYDILQLKGKAAYDHYQQQVWEATGSRIFVFVDGQPGAGDEGGGILRQLIERARGTEKPQLHKSDGRLYVAGRLSESDDQMVIVGGVHALQPPPMHAKPGAGKLFGPVRPPFLLPGDLLRFGILLIVAAGVCYVLARSLTSPVRRLRRATQLIAGGDFSARAGLSKGKTGYEIADLGRDFDIMAEKTEQLIASQKRLVRDISHELRSPLARLGVALELARTQYGDGDDRLFMKIGAEAERLNELIGQLLTLNRLETSDNAQQFEYFNLMELVVQIIHDADFESQGRGNGVVLVAGEDVVVHGARDLLQRAIENIVRNGVRYTAEKSQVEISLSTTAEGVVVSIRDFGPGIPEQDLPHIFDPFYRVAAARDRKSGGTGIGLAIAEQAVKLHGGVVQAANAPGRGGLIVSLCIPRGQPGEGT